MFYVQDCSSNALKTSCRLVEHLYRVLSSAKLHISVFTINKNKSLIKMLNISGPKIDPCGTPNKILNH